MREDFHTLNVLIWLCLGSCYRRNRIRTYRFPQTLPSLIHFLSQFEMILLSNFISGPLIIHSKLILFFHLGDCGRITCVSGVWIHSMWSWNLSAFPENVFCAGQPQIRLEPPMKGRSSLTFPKAAVLALIHSLYFVFVQFPLATETFT